MLSNRLSSNAHAYSFLRFGTSSSPHQSKLLPTTTAQRRNGALLREKSCLLRLSTCGDPAATPRFPIPETQQHLLCAAQLFLSVRGQKRSLLQHHPFLPSTIFPLENRFWQWARSCTVDVDDDDSNSHERRVRFQPDKHTSPWRRKHVQSLLAREIQSLGLVDEVAAPDRMRCCRRNGRKHMLSSSSSSGKESSSSESHPSSPLDGTVDAEKWLQEEAWAKKANTTMHQEQDWEEADRQMRRTQGAAARRANEARAANVMRALRGNVVISIAKLGAWASSGSSAMLSEFIHSVVDCANQALILVGLRDSDNAADRKHPYGYGKSLYFWSLISALGTFWMGAGLSMRHSFEQLLHPSLSEVTWELWSVLVLSFVVDGYVLAKTIGDVRQDQPDGVSFWQHIWKIRDPALMAILLEDGAACLGVVIAGGGIALTAASGMPVFDGLAGVGVSCVLGGMGLALVRLNKEFLLGQAQDRETMAGIEQILLQQPSIEHVHSLQSQIIGHGTFSVKAEVDFDGTYLAALLLPRYQKEFLVVGDKLAEELRVLLSWYAEDVMRVVEREVRRIEYEIRKVYPGAAYIELEPYSKDLYRYAVDDALEGKLKRIEIEALNRYLKSLYMDNYAKLTAQARVSKRKTPGEIGPKKENVASKKNRSGDDEEGHHDAK